MAKTHTIKFEDTEDWWELRTYLPVALEREYIQHAVDAQETYTNQDPELIKSLAERMDKLVVQSTIAWSYGPVDLDTLYQEVPGPQYMQVAEWVGQVYGPLVSKSIEKGLEIYTQHLNQEENNQSL